MNAIQYSSNKPTTTIEIPIADLEKTGAIGSVVAVAEKIQASPGEAMLVMLKAFCGKAPEEIKAMRDLSSQTEAKEKTQAA